MNAAIFSMTLPSEPRMLSVARGFVEAVCEARRIDPGIAHALVIVTGEAITNIIRHAHRDRETAHIHLRLEVRSDSVVLIFEDEGDPFELAAVPQLPPGELRIGGRGIYLMRTLMDEVTCGRREHDGTGNVLRLTKRVSASPVALAKSS